MYVVDPERSASRPERVNRVRAVASAVMLVAACCALLALVGVGDDSAGWASLAISHRSRRCHWQCGLH